jgi:hypothetical protein
VLLYFRFRIEPERQQNIDLKADAVQIVRSVDLTDYSRLSDLLEDLKREAFQTSGGGRRWPYMMSIADQKDDVAAELGFTLLKEMACKASFKGRYKCSNLLIDKCNRAECATCTRTGSGHRIEADIPLPLVATDLVVRLCAKRRGHEVSKITNDVLLVHVTRGGFDGCHVDIGNSWRLQTVYVGGASHPGRGARGAARDRVASSRIGEGERKKERKIRRGMDGRAGDYMG